MAKYNIEYIRKSMENEGYILISDTYSSTKKLKYVCSKGHRNSMIVCNWVKGKRCPECSKEKMGINRRIDFNTIIKSFESEGYVLLSDGLHYSNNRHKLDYICPRGHKHNISWTKWQQGERCYYCNGSVKKTIEDVREGFEKEGYVLLTTDYINSRSKLEYICPRGHKHSMVWGHWQQGRRCPECAIENKSGSGHPNWKGGISKEPYCQDWTNDLKDFVKHRDGYKCLNPDCWCKDDTLAVHHINYNKKVCGPENLITVCRSCNGRANTDRNWHKAWYQAILNKRYGYIYNGS